MPNKIELNRATVDRYNTLLVFYEKLITLSTELNKSDLSFENQYNYHLMNKMEMEIIKIMKNNAVGAILQSTKGGDAIFELNCKIKNDAFIKSTLSKCRNDTDVLRSASNITEIRKCIYLMENCGLSKKTTEEIKGYKHAFRDLYNTAIQVSIPKNQ